MTPIDISKLVPAILAISVAGERLVTFLKTLVPFLASPKGPNAGNDSTREIIRQVMVMAISFGACWLTACLAKIETGIPDILVGLLASGGSAFWTNILNYVKGVKDVKTQMGEQAKLKTAELATAIQNK